MPAWPQLTESDSIQLVTPGALLEGQSLGGKLGTSSFLAPVSHQGLVWKRCSVDIGWRLTVTCLVILGDYGNRGFAWGRGTRLPKVIGIDSPSQFHSP